MKSESSIQASLRLFAAQSGAGLWRNNNGACRDDTGRLIRYGLGNDSAKINAVWKSPDLIGIVPVRIGPEHVGQTLGVFLGVECKREGWSGVSNDREHAQLNCINNFTQLGGRAGFATSADDLVRIMKGEA